MTTRAKTKKEKPLTTISDDDRKAVIDELHKTWDYIKYDFVDLSPTKEVSAQDIRECVPDYLGMHGNRKMSDLFWRLDRTLSDDILKEAFPRGACM